MEGNASGNASYSKKTLADTRRIILASASPRRRILLRQIGLTFEVVPAAFTEVVENGADPAETVERLAMSKAEAVVGYDAVKHDEVNHAAVSDSREKRSEAKGSEKAVSPVHESPVRDSTLDDSPVDGSPVRDYANALVIGADTVVVLDTAILGKPDTPDQAHAMLRSLSGRQHQVYTGVSLIRTGPDGKIIARHPFHECTNVTFGDLSDADIDAYVSGGSPMDKAGAYGIQDDLGALFVRKIEGDYYNVVGFPLFRFYREVNKLAPGLVTPFDNAVKRNSSER